MSNNQYIQISNEVTRAENPITNSQANIPATKQFVVNATGNLFVATTLSSPGTPENISDEAKTAFGQVSVFFAAMTKAMSESGKSLYDFESLNNLIKGSGLFVNITKSTVKFESKKWGVAFSNELIQALLGLSGNLASVVDSLRSLIGSIGSEGFNIGSSKNNASKTVGTVIFVCEYLMGAVSITPLVFYIDAAQNMSTLEVGPCFNHNSQKMTLNIEKEVHLFVPPKFIEYASELNQAMSDPEFNNLVEAMKKSIQEPSTTKTPKPSGDGSATTGK